MANFEQVKLSAFWGELQKLASDGELSWLLAKIAALPPTTLAHEGEEFAAKMLSGLKGHQPGALTGIAKEHNGFVRNAILKGHGSELGGAHPSLLPSMKPAPMPSGFSMPPGATVAPPAASGMFTRRPAAPATMPAPAMTG